MAEAPFPTHGNASNADSSVDRGNDGGETAPGIAANHPIKLNSSEGEEFLVPYKVVSSSAETRSTGKALISVVRQISKSTLVKNLLDGMRYAERLPQLRFC